MKVYCFIDASNLFYGGEKSLGWKIDYQSLIKYLKNKYGVSKVQYFGGVELHGYKYDYLKHDTIPLEEVYKHLSGLIKGNKNLTEGQLLLIDRHLQRVKFYRKLESFGYELFLKPVKLFYDNEGGTQRKANCDVEMAFYVMKEINQFNKMIFMSGDGDFLPILKYARNIGKEVIVLARGERTAKEIRQFAAGSFADFVKLKKELMFQQ